MTVYESSSQKEALLALAFYELEQPDIVSNKSNEYFNAQVALLVIIWDAVNVFKLASACGLEKGLKI